MSLTTLKVQRKLAIGASKRAHGKWAKSVATSSAISEKLKKASGATKVALQAQLRGALGQSRTLHGKWRAAVAKLVAINAKIAVLAPTFATVCTQALADAVGVFEGGQSSDGLFHAYQDVVGVWTIGYGHTAADGAPVPGPGVRALTKAEAETLLLHDLNTAYAPDVARAVKGFKWSVNQKQFDALTSFCYNLGPGYFGSNHDVGAAMSRHDATGVANAMMEYDRAGSQVLAGLLRRRTWERQLFLGGTYTV